MRFIEMTGKELSDVIADDDVHLCDLPSAGIHDQTIVRVNEQGDIEVRRAHGWDVIGGLLGDFTHRVRQRTGRDWA